MVGDGDDSRERYSPDGGTEPADTPYDPTAAGLPTDRGPTDDEIRQQFRQEYEPDVRELLADDGLLEAATGQYDADREAVHAEITAVADDPDAAYDAVRAAVIEEAEDRYMKDHTLFRNKEPRDLAEAALGPALGDMLATYRLRDGVEERYDGEDIDPRTIRRRMLDELMETVEDRISEHDPVAEQILAGQRIRPDELPDRLDGSLTAAIDRMESRVGEPMLGVGLDSTQPAVQEVVASGLLDDIGRELQRTAAGTADHDQEALDRLQERYQRTLDRFRVGETLDELERSWGTGDLPYAVYEIDDPGEMQQAARELGNCRTAVGHYYERLAEDPFTTVLGVRRDDHDEWIGMARMFHMETPDDEQVLAIDNLGMQYRDGAGAGEPEDCCDFEAFGDALPVMGLSAIAYGLDQGSDAVVAGRDDQRVGGGPGDGIGVAQLYSTKNTDEEELPLEKRGVRDMDQPYGLVSLLDPHADQQMALLFEDPRQG